MFGKSMRFLFSVGLAILTTCAQTESQSVQVSYSIFVGDDVHQAHSISTGVPEKSTFYDAMVVAAAENPTFRFSITEYPGLSHYISTVAGVTEDRKENIYWMFYVLDKPADSKSLPNDDSLSDVGVDDTIVSEDNFYLLWLRSV